MAERVIVTIVSPDGEHRSEDLIAVDLGVLGHIGQEGGQVEEPGRVGSRSAGNDAGALGGCAGDDRGDLVTVRTRDDRAEIGVGILRVAHDELAHEFGHPGHEIVVKIAGHDRAGGCRAVLPGVDQRPCHRAVDRGVEVSVVEHHERRLAAEFELGAMAVNSGGRHDFSAHRSGSGEGHHVHSWMAHQPISDLRPAGNDIDNAI